MSYCYHAEKEKWKVSPIYFKENLWPTISGAILIFGIIAAIKNFAWWSSPVIIAITFYVGFITVKIFKKASEILSVLFTILAIVLFLIKSDHKR